MASKRLCVIAALCLLPFAIASAEGLVRSDIEAPHRSPFGDWLGWAYLDGGADFPLRIRFEQDSAGELTARFDDLVSRRYDLPFQRVTWSPPRLEIERKQPSGAVIRLEGELDGEVLRGRLEWGTHKGKFELEPSLERLSRVAPERFDDCEGVYRLAPGRSLVVSKRFWGELVYNDLATGRTGTLFPVDQDQFVAGSAMYVASTVSARVRFIRNEERQVDRIEWREKATGALLGGERIAFAEEEVAFAANDGAVLAGTLIRPVGSRPLPAIVVLGGSNWRDRNALRLDATMLASLGMAVLFYDQRGHGASQGDAVVPFSTSAADAVAAVEWLQSRSDVLADQIGLIGRSRGGWFAPLAASISDQVKFLVLLVAPAVSPADQEATRRLNMLRVQGTAADLVEAAEEALRLAWHYGATAQGWEPYLAARARALAAGVPEDLLETDRPDPEAWRWIRLNMAYDPTPALERVRVPVLALFGEADRNVVPEENMPRMRRALERAGNDDVQLVVVPDADHGLRTAPVGAGNLPPHRQTGHGPTVWPVVERWLAARWMLWGNARVDPMTALREE